MTQRKSGYTLIEIMITLIIMAAILAMGVFTMSSYLPRQRLLGATETVEQALSRAQMEASARSAWSCMTLDTTTNSLVVRMDTNANRNCETSDLQITTMQLHPDIIFANCTNASENSFYFPTASDAIWFDSASVPKTCASGICTTQSLQIVVVNPNLPDGNRAREIEAISSGMIKIIDRNDKGFVQGIFAKSVDLTTNGCQ